MAFPGRIAHFHALEPLNCGYVNKNKLFVSKPLNLEEGEWEGELPLTVLLQYMF